MTGIVSRMARPRRCPPESYEQLLLARWLDFTGVLWLHPPNEGKRSPMLGKRLKDLGLKAGAPDVLIFTPPPCALVGQFRGTAIELKRERGGVATPEQQAWLAALGRVGWTVQVCHGAAQAIRWLQSLGYGR